MKKKLLILLLLSFTLFLGGCGKDIVIPEENPIVTMEIEDYGTIKMELYPKIAYNTVANFVTLVEDGFYDNNTFHRLVKGFVLQGGDPTATGSGNPGYTIKGEFALNGVNNSLSHDEGIISMARGNDNNSAGSQFFIVLDDSAKTSLDGRYAAFGKVIEGMDIIKGIEKADLELAEGTSDILKKPLTIKSTTVDTKGYEYVLEKMETN